MLNAGTQTAKRQADDQAEEAAAPADQEIGDGRRRGPSGEKEAFADALREKAGGDLQAGHDAGIDRLEETDLRQG